MKRKSVNCDLVEDAIAARNRGMTYGAYKAAQNTVCESIREKRIREGTYNPVIRVGGNQK